MIGQNPQTAHAFRAAWEPLAGQGGAVPGAELLNTVTDAEFPGALLPARGSDGIPVFYAVAPDARSWYLLTPLLTAFAGLTTTDFYGPPTALNPADPLENLIVASGCYAAARLRVTAATATLAERALGRLYSTWRQAPRGRRALTESTGTLLSRFHAALAICDVATARTILAQLEHERRLDALNLNFLEIATRSAVGDWSGLLALECLPHVLAARRPPAISAAIAEAVWRRQLAPALESGGVAAAIAVYRTETRQFAAVLGNLPRNAPRCVFAVMAVAVLAGDLAYAALTERIGEAGVDELPPALAQALPFPALLAPYLPDFRYVLCDLSGLDAAEIQGNALLRVALLTMKYIGDPQLAARLPEIFGLLSVFGDQRTVLGYLETLLRYLAAAAVTVSEADVSRALVEVLPTLEERIMPTMVETWLEQGIQTGEKRMLLRLLERRFGKVPKTYQTRITAADADTLLLWSERVLFAHRLADVFSEPSPSEPAG